MHPRTSAAANPWGLSAVRVMLVGMDGWTLGRRANCGKPLDPGEHPSLFCCKFCKGYAKDVRYFRAWAKGRTDSGPGGSRGAESPV